MSGGAGADLMTDPAGARPPLSGIIFNKGIVRRAAIVALIVGTILNLIAQGDFLLEGQQISVWKICLTYCVPYCVATYGAVTARLETYRTLEKTGRSKNA